MVDLKKLPFYPYILLNALIPLAFFWYFAEAFKYGLVIFGLLWFAHAVGAFSGVYGNGVAGGLAILSFGLFAFFGYLNMFFQEKLVLYTHKDFMSLIDGRKDGNIPNLALALDFYSATLLYPARALNAYIVLNRALDHPRLSFVFERIGIDRNAFRAALREKMRNVTGADAEFLPQLLAKAMDIAQGHGHNSIAVGDLFSAAVFLDNYLKEYFLQVGLDEQDIANIVFWEETAFTYRMPRRRLNAHDLLYAEGIGKSWSYGYTPHLDRFAVDVRDYVASKHPDLHVTLRQDLADTMAEVLAKDSANSVVVVGENGSGRTELIYALARDIREGRSLSPLNFKKIVLLDVGGVIAAAGDTEDVQQMLTVILNEAARAGNIILAIDNFSDYIGAEEGIGKVDISAVLAPYIKSNVLQVIGIATFIGYHDKIAPNPALSGLFNAITLPDMSATDTIRVLEDYVPHFEQRYRAGITYPVLKEIVKRTDELIADVPFPQKAVSALEEVMVSAASHRRRIVAVQDVDDVIGRKAGVSLGTLQGGEAAKLLDLENLLHQRIIGQDLAVSLIAQAMKRGRLEVASHKKPIGSFLFLGPTGVGKTETAKALAAIYFGAEQQMVRLDMSEYQQPEDEARFIGSSKNDLDQAFITKVREKPSSLILLDEIEKAHPKILNLFLQILDDGRLTDAIGRTVSFRNTIIIATSNAGSNMIRQAVEAHKDFSSFHKELLDYLQNQNIFTPEFLNRFDETVVFKPLTKENLIAIARLLMASLNDRLRQAHDITVAVTDDMLDAIADIGYEPEFGARPMRRAIQDTVESIVADKLLSGEAPRGSTLTISVADIRAKANVRM